MSVDRNAVRASLEQGTSEEDVRRLRRRVLRGLLFALAPLANLFAARVESGRHFMIVGSLTILVVVATLWRYRSLAPVGPRVVSDDEVEQAAREAQRCPRCGHIVLTVEQGECLDCGAL